MASADGTRGPRKALPAAPHRPGRRAAPSGHIRAARSRFGLVRHLGPGLVTGAADDDPSGIGTYSQVGAQFGLGMVWTVLFTLPLAAAVEELAGRLGLCGGRGLATLIKRHLPTWVLYASASLVAGANVFNIGADLGSMAAAMHLVVPVPTVVLLFGVAVALLAAEILVSYHRYARVLRFTTLALLSYIGVLFAVHVQWGAVLRSLVVPTLSWDPAFLAALVAVFGTTISPYLMFWQASEEVEELLDKKRRGRVRSRDQVQGMRLDVIAGMTSAVVVMFAIIVATASTLHAHGITDVATADAAARALRPIAGNFAGLLFAVGIVGTGALAIPVLAGSTGYALAEAFGWREGLSLQFRQARGFYLVIGGAMLVGLILNFVGLNPIRALVYSAILNGVAAPPLILVMLILANREGLLQEWRSRWLSNLLVGAALLVMTALPLAYLVHH